jgi:hypothetical protein
MVFPAPDNWSKVKRSVDNAQHIGLFPPRAGQQTRDEQRRRRSQYDRGTPRAQAEESYNRRRYHRPPVRNSDCFTMGYPYSPSVPQAMVNGNTGIANEHPYLSW